MVMKVEGARVVLLPLDSPGNLGRGAVPYVSVAEPRLPQGCYSSPKSITFACMRLLGINQSNLNPVNST